MTHLTAKEARQLADRADEWPPGLGFVIEPHDSSRGWRRVPDYRPFGPPTRVDGEGAMYCPVVLLHETRRVDDEREPSYMSGHLDAFWTIVAALEETWHVSRDEAHQRYNHLLKTDPQQLATALRTYADTRSE